LQRSGRGGQVAQEEEGQGGGQDKLQQEKAAEEVVPKYNLKLFKVRYLCLGDFGYLLKYGACFLSNASHEIVLNSS
jgi:hypothetical protein